MADSNDLRMAADNIEGQAGPSGCPAGGHSGFAEIFIQANNEGLLNLFRRSRSLRSAYLAAVPVPYQYTA